MVWSTILFIYSNRNIKSKFTFVNASKTSVELGIDKFTLIIIFLNEDFKFFRMILGSNGINENSTQKKRRASSACSVDN